MPKKAESAPPSAASKPKVPRKAGGSFNSSLASTLPYNPKQPMDRVRHLAADPSDRSDTGPVIGAYAPQFFADGDKFKVPTKSRAQLDAEAILREQYGRQNDASRRWMERIANPNPSTTAALDLPWTTQSYSR